jgi:hypothetical protein
LNWPALRWTQVSGGYSLGCIGRAAQFAAAAAAGVARVIGKPRYEFLIRIR